MSDFDDMAGAKPASARHVGFDESKVRRGQPGNPGQFRSHERGAPGGQLAAPSAEPSAFHRRMIIQELDDLHERFPHVVAWETGWFSDLDPETEPNLELLSIRTADGNTVEIDGDEPEYHAWSDNFLRWETEPFGLDLNNNVRFDRASDGSLSYQVDDREPVEVRSGPAPSLDHLGFDPATQRIAAYEVQDAVEWARDIADDPEQGDHDRARANAELDEYRNLANQLFGVGREPYTGDELADLFRDASDRGATLLPDHDDTIASWARTDGWQHLDVNENQYDDIGDHVNWAGVGRDLLGRSGHGFARVELGGKRMWGVGFSD